MCNLYRMTKPASEVAAMFGDIAVEIGNAGMEVYPGQPGLVFDGERARSMVWGFPLSRKGKQGQPLKPKPVNNTRADRVKSFFWRYSFEERRCLLPLTGFAEAEGPKGGKTRTWISLPDAELFSVAGIWRESDEWGPCYSMMMTEACIDMDGVHDRMPVILREADRARWMEGTPSEAYDLCRPWAGALALDRTREPWVLRR
ncbi:SOS response-associated peptidase [Qipengyuania sp. MTN3-11]|uniref:SOS response-associated peptidase n=1 Tax=Qipengyuania sp. MTN3-11 TaxID=3056557 RepID=UPI0036F1BBE2